MHARSLSILAVVLLAAGCAGRRIPGTEIRDTADTREIVQTIDLYRQAAERRDAAGVIALVSPKYFDDAGTPDPADDLDFDELRGKLFANYRQLAAIRLSIGVKDVDVKGDHATADVFYDGYYRIATGTAQVPKQASDVARMSFVREDGKWKILSGL